MLVCSKTHRLFSRTLMAVVALLERIDPCMTSAHALELAHQIYKNDPEAIRPLIALLYGCFESRGDPLGETMMKELLGGLYVQTEHCLDTGIKDYVSRAA